MTEQTKLLNWIKEHKRELIIAGISITALTVIAWIIVKHPTSITNLWNTLKAKINGLQNIAKKPASSELIPTGSENQVSTAMQHHQNAAHVVKEHYRNLPNGHHASAEKIAYAKINRIPLKEGQTIVNSYTTGNAA